MAPQGQHSRVRCGSGTKHLPGAGSGAHGARHGCSCWMRRSHRGCEAPVPCLFLVGASAGGCSAPGQAARGTFAPCWRWAMQRVPVTRPCGC